MMNHKTRLLAASGLMAAAYLGLAQAQTTPPDIRPGHTPGVGTSYPVSPNAANITAGDTASPIAPTAPEPSTGPDASVQQLLNAATQSISAGKTGTADNALEDAETQILTRSVPQSAGETPSTDPVIAQIEQARQALASNNRQGATEQISQILSSNAPELQD